MKQKKNCEGEGAADEQRHEWRVGADDFCQKKERCQIVPKTEMRERRKGFYTPSCWDAIPHRIRVQMANGGR